MKKKVVALVIAALAVGAILIGNLRGPGEDLEVVCYFRTLRIPVWTPLSLGYPPGSEKNPIYLELRNMRYFIMIVSVPARRLSALNETENSWADKGNDRQWREPNMQNREPDMRNRAGGADRRRYPEFTMTLLKDGRSRKAHRVVFWPRDKRFTGPADFQDESDWCPKPTDHPNKRYRLAVMWRVGKKWTIGPFELQMNDDPPVHVSKKKNNYYHKWQGW